MKKLSIIVVACLVSFVLALLWVRFAVAFDQCAVLSGADKVSCYNQKLSETQGQERTLSSQIDGLNKQIATTELQVTTTEAKLDRLNNDIASVSGKIDLIEESLAHVSDVLANRIVKTYIAGRDDPVLYLLSSADFGDLWQRLDYLQLAQKHDKNLMLQMAQTRKNYNDQKGLLEDKKKEIETLSIQLKAYQVQLNRQNQEKQSLLSITKNDESRYQELLANAQREIASVNASQYSGKKDVKKGDIVGLMGNTGFSTGAHLHFGVYNLSENQAGSFNYVSGTNNPLDYLKNQSMYVDSGACYDKSGQNNIGGGGWDWPMNGPHISQCYGKTPFSFVYANGLHEGLDMYNNGDTTVRAVDDGVAYFYRDSGNGFGNNVRVFHSNGKMTLYLHLQ